MLVNDSNSMPYMKSLVTCLNRIIADGYTEDFKVTDNGLEALQHGNRYKAADVSILNSFRFEGDSNPEDNAILYVVQTIDGLKGTLIDAYGLYDDQRITRFIENVTALENKATNQ